MESCNLTTLSVEGGTAVNISCNRVILLPDNILFNGCLLGMMREHKWAPVKIVIDDIEYNILLTQNETELGAGEIYASLLLSGDYKVLYTHRQIEVGVSSICLNLLNMTQSLN